MYKIISHGSTKIYQHNEIVPKNFDFQFLPAMKILVRNFQWKMCCARDQC